MCFFGGFAKKYIYKKLCKKNAKNFTHPDQSKKKHKIEVPFSLFPKYIKEPKNQKNWKFAKKYIYSKNSLKTLSVYYL